MGMEKLIQFRHHHMGPYGILILDVNDDNVVVDVAENQHKVM